MFLSLTFKVPYIYTIIWILAWSVFGHFITIDDDMPGGWENPDGDQKIWRLSWVEFAFKFVLLLVILYIAYAVPGLTKFGS